MTIEEIKEYNEKKAKETIELCKQKDKQAQEAFEKRIDKEWENHVKRCINKGEIIGNNFVMKVKGYRLPYYMENTEYSYTSNNGTFRVHFEGSGISWFHTVYYYTVLNMNIV